MSLERALQPRSARVIVVANEKGGSGKSTVAMHVAVALLKSGQSVATIDLDGEQQTFTHYIENRRAWAAQAGRALEIPTHLCVEGKAGQPTDDDAQANTLIDAVDELAKSNSFIVIDTPGHKSSLTQLVHAMADTLITPLNDSFIDLDVLGAVDRETFQITDSSHYARMVEEARRQRRFFTQAPTDWIVLRNRLSMTASRNKRLVGEGLAELSRRLGFRTIDGLAERVVFREFFPRGLTALDDLNEGTLGTRPTMSHATARLEVQALIAAVTLGAAATTGELDQARSAA